MKYGITFLILLTVSSSCSDDGQPVEADASVIDAAPGIDAMPRLDPYWTAIPADELGARDRAGLAFDAATQRLILVSGCRVDPFDGSCRVVNDVWILDLSNGLAQARWTELSPAGEPPPFTTDGFDVSYDPASGRLLVLVGGIELMEPWVLENANGIGAPRWIPLTATGTETPSLRRGAFVGHDPERDRMYMFGGQRSIDFTALGDIWMLENASGVDGAPRWQALPQTGTQPEARANHGGLVVPSQNQMFLFAGSNNGFMLADGWVVDLGQPVTARRIIDELPVNLVFTTAGYSPERNELLFLGGTGSMPGDSPRFDAVWHMRLADPPEALAAVELPADEPTPFPWSAGPPSLYDAASDRLFLFGVGDEAENPDDVLWILSNASAE